MRIEKPEYPISNIECPISNSGELAVETVGLTKVFTRAFGRDRVVALDGLDLRVARGQIFGLLGPNGAGKTTLVKILLGIAAPTGGAARMLGRDIADVRNRARIGYLPENPRYPTYLNGAQVLDYFGRLSGVDEADRLRRTEELLSLVKMDRWRGTKTGKYSKGMMQRLGIAQALINDPELVFFDEPTDGVDPIGRREIRDILVDLKCQGKTIFLNSHLLSEVELVCDTVAILNKGRLIRYGSVRELTADAHRYRMEVEGLSEEVEREIARAALFWSRDDRYLDVSVSDVAALNRIIDLLRAGSITSCPRRSRWANSRGLWSREGRSKAGCPYGRRWCSARCCWGSRRFCSCGRISEGLFRSQFYVDIRKSS